MKTLQFLLLASLVACADAGGSDLDLAAEEAESVPAATDGKSDSSWAVASTFHVGTERFDTATAGGRRIFPVWLAGTSSKPVVVDLRAVAAPGYDVRITVLGPLVNGKRAVLGADGYSTKKTDTKLRITTKQRGEHQIVVGSYNLATDTFFDVTANCVQNCGTAKLDVLAAPKAGALVGNSNRVVSATLGEVLANRTYDVQVELWASPPAQPWSATKVATGVASGNQANIIVPSTVREGDDIQVVVREAGGRVLDSGVPTRFAPRPIELLRTDAILYGDLVSLDISGVVAFYEGHATVALRSRTRNIDITQTHVEAKGPGSVGNGFNAVNAFLAPEFTDAQGNLNPNLPRNGELLSVGVIGGGTGEYKELGCFEYCNDLSGMETCTGGPRACR